MISFFVDWRLRRSDLKKTRLHVIILVVTFLVVIGIDMLSKYLLTDKYFTLIPNFISISYKENTGAAGSILEGHTSFLIVVSLVFLIAMFVFDYFLKEKNWFYSLSFGLLLAGAIGNLFDRIVFGYVRDFIRIEFINFPFIFNVADMALTIGVICLCVYFLFFYKDKKKNEV